MAGSFTALYYHIVFATKDRQPLLAKDITPRIHEYMAGIMRGIGGIPIMIGGAADHVHILGSLDKSSTIPNSLRILKSHSSKWIHETFPLMADFAWQEGYGAFSVSMTGLDRIKVYIEKQEEHHRVVTFQEEFSEFLRRHEISFDERYMWT